MGVIVGLCVVNIGLMAFILFKSQDPQRTGPPGMPPEDRPRHLIIQKLSFNDQQVAAYDELIYAHRDTIRQLERKIMDTKNKLYGTLVNGGAKDTLVAELAALQQQIETVHYNHFIDIKKLCRPEQQQKFNELTRELAEYFRPHKRP